MLSLPPLQHRLLKPNNTFAASQLATPLRARSLLSESHLIGGTYRWTRARTPIRAMRYEFLMVRGTAGAAFQRKDLMANAQG
jgi:hypothetical protein